MIENVMKKIKDFVEFNELNYNIRFWDLDNEDLFAFLKINYDEVFNLYFDNFFQQQMVSYFRELTNIAVESNIIINNKTLISYLHLIQYNKLAKNDFYFDYNIIKSKFNEFLNINENVKKQENKCCVKKHLIKNNN